MKLVFDPARGFDLALTSSGGIDPGIGNGGSLEAAVWVSVFTDLLAEAGEMSADLGSDRRGWWGDSGRERAGCMGSLLWLHMREKLNETGRRQIENAVRESLQWLIADGIVADVAVSAVRLGRADARRGIEAGPADAVRLRIELTEPNGVRRDWKVDLLWSGVAG